MSTYLCFIRSNDTPGGVIGIIVEKINAYSCVKSNNVKYFQYHREVSEEYINYELHSLDYCILMKDVFSTVNDIYDDELNGDSFYDYPLLVDGFFERIKYINNVRFSLSKKLLGLFGLRIYIDVAIHVRR